MIFGPAPPAALVLAAGLSRRMAPDNKLLLAMPNGQPMIAQTVERVLTTSARPVIVVTGHQSSQIRAALAGKPIQFVHAPNYADGMASSLHAGISALPENTGAVLICLGDMPLMEPQVLERIIAAYDPMQGREIILPRYQGQRGNPVLWGRRFFDEILQLSGDIGAQRMLRHHREFIAEIPVDTDTILKDFDTPEAFC